MENCRTCGSWIKQNVEGLEGFGVCVKSMASSGVPVMLHVKHVAHDQDGFGAYMMTHPDFGCVEHEDPPPRPLPPVAEGGKGYY